MVLTSSSSACLSQLEICKSTCSKALPEKEGSMLRSIAGVVLGIIAWFVVATIGNLILRAVLPGYAAVEVSMNFTLAMMLGRLLLGLLSSLGAGFVAGAIGRNRLAPRVAAALMLIMFLPVHYLLWDKFPIWYHLFFLISLAPMILVGASLAPSRTK